MFQKITPYNFQDRWIRQKITQYTPIFPCKRDKTPYTPNGFKNATQSEKTLSTWSDQYPDAIIGIPIGNPYNDLVVIDIDQYKAKTKIDDPINWFKQNPSIFDLLNDTAYAQQTVSGGIHCYYRDSHKLLTKNAHNVAPHIDIRADGKGYVIAYNQDVLAKIYDILYKLNEIPHEIANIFNNAKKKHHIRPIVTKYLVPRIL